MTPQTTKNPPAVPLGPNELVQRNRLLGWYTENKRDLPWRQTRQLKEKAYGIWISEVMLQQTTTTAVIPYYERFLKRFPTLNSLAEAPLSDVLEVWAGLGYYSRARNLHKSAKAVVERGGFPKRHEDLLTLPGFGPYTARSVASLAFGESVGVVDGNVIRVFSRFLDEPWEHWRPKVRDEIQKIADQWVSGVSSSDLNQALMELGRTICTPKSPKCLLCPIQKGCLALKKDKLSQLPLSKPKRARESWIVEAVVSFNQRQDVLLVLNQEAPFLKNQWTIPLQARKTQKKPKQYDYLHSITHHDIFVTVTLKNLKLTGRDQKWVSPKEIKQHVPASFILKAFQFIPDQQKKLFS